MKAKVNRGAGVRGLLNYALDQGQKKAGLKSAEIVGGNMAGTDPRELAKEFGIARALRPECSRPVWHCSLSLPQGEKIPPEKWQEVTEKFMEKMGLDPDSHQYVVCRHSDTEYDHTHIVASRINLAGEIWHGKWEAKTAIKATQALEKELGLVITQGLESPGQEKKPTANEIQMSARTMEAPPRAVLQKIIKKELAGKPTTAEFLERLEISGVHVRPNIASTGRVSGLAFEHANITFKGSQLGKKFSWTGLQKQGLNYEQDRDSAALSTAKERFDRRQNKPVDRSPGQSAGDHRPGDQRTGAAGDRDQGPVELDPNTIRPVDRPGQINKGDSKNLGTGPEDNQRINATGKDDQKKHSKPHQNRRDNGPDLRAGVLRPGDLQPGLSAGSNKGAIMIKNELNNANEIERFKKEINLVEYAASKGFSLDKRKSSRKTAILRRSGEKIAISTNANGHGVFADLHDIKNGGSIIDFCQRETGQNLGQVRKELRQFSGIPRVETELYKPIKGLSKEAQVKVFEKSWKELSLIHESKYLQGRGISPETLKDPRFKKRVCKDRRGNVCFPHVNQKSFCGFEKKNQEFTGFSEGGEKGIWSSSPQEQEEKLIFTESGIDALSHAQMHPDNKARYVSLGGQFSHDQEKIVQKMIAKNPALKVVSAFDNDDPGRRYAADIKRLANEKKTVEDFPQAKDWNQELQIELARIPKEKKEKIRTPEKIKVRTQAKPLSAVERLQQKRKKEKNNTKGMSR